MNEIQMNFMREAIRLSKESVKNGGGPFGAIIVKDNQIIARGNNQVTSQHDPTAHAEVVAIREACKQLGTFQLAGCDLYTSCEPCPMCLGAIYWARPDQIYYANTKIDAAAIGFDDQFIYDELKVELKDRKIPMARVLGEEAIAVFQMWDNKEDKISY